MRMQQASLLPSRKRTTMPWGKRGVRDAAELRIVGR